MTSIMMFPASALKPAKQFGKYLGNWGKHERPHPPGTIDGRRKDINDQYAAWKAENSK